MSEHEWAEARTRFVTGGTAGDFVDEAVRGPLSRQFAQLTTALLHAETVAEVLEQVVHATTRVVPAADVVSITLRSPEGRFHTPVETDPIAVILDELQYSYHEGPCHDAAEPSGPAVSDSPNLRLDTRWPNWGPAAADLGVGAVLAIALVPTPHPPQLSGALNVYSREPYGLDGTDRDQVLLLATHASLAVARTAAVTQAQLREEHLRQAIDSRDVIGQAKGIIMSRRGVSADEAFDILRRTSQQLNVKLAQLAETLTTRHGDLDGVEPG